MKTVNEMTRKELLEEMKFNGQYAKSLEEKSLEELNEYVTVFVRSQNFFKGATFVKF